MSYFPIFVELEGKECLVVGGGGVAFRKVQVLREFGAAVTVVAPEIIQGICSMDGVKLLKRKFQTADLEGKALVVAAVNDKGLNHMISQECQKSEILVNAVDQQEDCTFIFPSYIKQKEVVGAFSSGGQSPVVTQYLKKQLQPVLNEYIGEIAECLGEIRQEVKQKVKIGNQRKCLYQEILGRCLEEGKLLPKEQLEQMIKHYSSREEETWIE